METYVTKERKRETDRRKIREHAFKIGRANNVHILCEIYVHILSYDYVLPRAEKYVSLGLSAS
jgi:hypothetical protein